jgi:cystathionine gamma-synthase
MNPTGSDDLNEQGFSTRAVWGGEPHDSAEGATVAPLFQGVTFAYEDMERWRAAGTGEGPGYIYSRNRNPTVELFEDKVRVLEGAPAATSFATGMAAVSNTLRTFLAPGDRVVSIRDSYGGTTKLFTDFLPRVGVEATLCPTEDHEALEAEIAHGCRLVYLESPTNPTLKILDLARLARAAHEVGALVVVDNTFATPINQRPLELGADLVLHSATKFLGGHSDAMGGVLVGARELVDQVFHFREINGASLDPMSAFLLARGLRTLELRVQRHNSNAQAVAEFLASHPRVDRVFYPGLSDHPGHEIASRQMTGFGGVLSFSLPGGMDEMNRVLGSLTLAHRAASLGSVATLVGPPAMTSHVEMSAEERLSVGIPETLIRYSAGIENPQDLVEDLRQALG